MRGHIVHTGHKTGEDETKIPFYVVVVGQYHTLVCLLAYYQAG